MTKSSARKAAAKKARSTYRKTTRKVGAAKTLNSGRKTASKAVAETAWTVWSGAVPAVISTGPPGVRSQSAGLPCSAGTGPKRSRD